MKIATVRDFRSKALSFLKENEPVLILRHGKITGLLHPIRDTSTLPEDLQKEVNTVLRSSKVRSGKTFPLKDLGRILNLRNVKIEDIKQLQKEWKFTGSLSEEVIRERDRR
jgi:hypothetical protein